MKKHISSRGIPSFAYLIFCLFDLHLKSVLATGAFGCVTSHHARQAQHLFASRAFFVNVRMPVASLILSQHKEVFQRSKESAKALIFHLTLVHVARKHSKNTIAQKQKRRKCQPNRAHEHICNIQGKRHHQRRHSQRITAVSAA